MTIRALLALRNARVRETVCRYHQRLRPVPMSPAELQAAAKQRQVKRQRVLPLGAGVPGTLPAPQIRNPLPHPAWLCPTPGCRSNLAGCVLQARHWAQGQREPEQRPRCNWCGKLRQYVEAGVVLATENTEQEEPKP